MSKFSKGEFSGLQTLPDVFFSTALRGLLANTFVVVSNPYVVQDSAFALKQYRVFIKYEDFGAGFPIFGLAPGGAAIADYEVSIENEITDPDDPVNFGEAAIKLNILWNSLWSIPLTGPATNADADQQIWHDTGWINVAGGSKGIPFQEDHGPFLFCYNADPAAMDADGDVGGLIVYRGYYLND